jgi:hypothetical protein
MRLILLALAFFGVATPAAAQDLLRQLEADSAPAIVVSDTPEAVNIAIYRDPNRGDSPIDRNWPSGYALISETRTISIPAGESVIRFEGVSEGMFPETAIVTGLPKGVSEKNRDGRLLSPYGLVDSYLKRRVSLTRTDTATGRSTTEDVLISAGPAGGVIVQTAAGYEAYQCTGLPERMSYGGVPANLSAKPTLSIITQSDVATTVTVQLTYMAAGFDWQANYIFETGPKGADGTSTGSLFAWMTVANGGKQSFENANLMAIAGVPNKEDNANPPTDAGGALSLNCWPQQRTDQVPYRQTWQDGDIDAYGGMKQYMPMPAAPVMMRAQAYESDAAMGVVVTAHMATEEDLGDLKLYRVPMPVTVNAQGQKQVALMVQDDVRYKRLYTGQMQQNGGWQYPRGATEGRYVTHESTSSLGWQIRSTNEERDGLGLPLPSGQVAIYEGSRFGPMLAGESSLKDRAIGDDVEINGSDSADLVLTETPVKWTKKRHSWTLTVTNARAEDVEIEIELPSTTEMGKGVTRKKSKRVWRTTVPANGKASITINIRMDGQS